MPRCAEHARIRQVPKGSNATKQHGAKRQLSSARLSCQLSQSLPLPRIVARLVFCAADMPPSTSQVHYPLLPIARALQIWARIHALEKTGTSLKNRKAQLAIGHFGLPANRCAKCKGLHTVDVLAEKSFIWVCLETGACHGILPGHLPYDVDADVLFQAPVADAFCLLALVLQRSDLKQGVATKGVCRK